MSIQLTIAAVYQFSDHIVPDKLPTVRSRQPFFHLPNKPVIEVEKGAGASRKRKMHVHLSSVEAFGGYVNPPTWPTRFPLTWRKEEGRDDH